jgi:hypothetical protein
MDRVRRLTAVLENTIARRSLIVLAWVVLVVGAVIYFNHRPGSTSANAVVSGPAEVTTNPNTTGARIPLPHAALDTARRFLATAVLRRNLSASWDLAAPALRAGFTRSRWLTGKIPVAEFPSSAFAKAGFKVVSSHQKQVTLLVYIFPRKGSHIAGWDYIVQLVPRAGSWQVGYWQPRGHEAPVRLQAMG